MDSLQNIIQELVENAFGQCGYDKKYALILNSNRPDLCQFQCNGAMLLAKQLKKKPYDIASDVVLILKEKDKYISADVVNPGFININLSDAFLTEYINTMNLKGVNLNGSLKDKKKIMIDFGGANVAKPLHVGHLRTAIIGETLKRIGRFLGYDVIGDVHLGDWGLQMGMVICEVRNRYPNLPYFDADYIGEYPSNPPFTIDELEEIYPAASKKAKENADFMKEVKAATLLMQNGMPGYIALWKHILNVSVKDLKKNYQNLNVSFDLWKGESDCQKSIAEIVGYFEKNSYSYFSNGAMVIDINNKQDNSPMPPIIILKSDGASLYSTTDLATIYDRVNQYNPDIIMYVVDKRQSLHFEQVFRCAKKTQIANENLKLEFIGYGTMNGKDGKPFKTRDGGVMRLEELLKIVEQKVMEKIDENSDIEDDFEKQQIAKKVSIAALKYGDLSNQISKDYIFDIDKFISFNGKTGPYILYTIVRIKSILKKTENEFKEIGTVINKPANDTERNIMLKLGMFNNIVKLSFDERSPHILCEFMYELSNLCNRFYKENKIISEKNKQTKTSWINLLKLSKDILETCCNLLGIDVPERM